MIKKQIIIILIVVCAFMEGKSQTMLTLEKALEIAGENSPSIIQSKLNLEASNAALEANLAGLKAKIGLYVTPFHYERKKGYDGSLADFNTVTSFSSGAGVYVSQSLKKTDSKITLRNTSGWGTNYSEYYDNTTTSYSNEINLSLEQPLFTYNRTKMNLEVLKLDLENAQIRYALQQLTIEQNVTNLFYQVYSIKKALNIAEEELKNRQKSYEISKNKVDAGLLAKGELIQSELELTTSQSDLYNQQVNLENAKDQLKQVIGISIDEDIEVLANIAIDSTEVDLQKAIDYALLNRMELRQCEIDIKNAYFNLTRQKDVNTLDGTLNMSVGLSGYNEELRNIYKDQEPTPVIDFSLDIPIFDWGQRKALIKQAEANIQVNELSLKEERINIKINIRSTYRNLKNLKLQIDIKEKNIESAQLSYDINLEKYSNGDLTSMELNQYQKQLSESKIALTQAIINYKLELLNLKIQSLWDFENDRPVIEKTNNIQ